MENEIRTIGILTSGGDAPGMNAAIRAVVRTAISMRMRVIGIKHGYQGLLNNDMEEMNIRSVSEILQQGGTKLYTARCLEFTTPEGVMKGYQNCRRAGIDALVTIGGDGTFKGALALSRLGLPCIGIPGTIDNDIVCSDYTIGYDTAMNTAVEMIDKLRDTTRSHSRCSIVEVMGHNSGVLAANIGLACGALVTLVPEVKADYDKDVIDRIFYTESTGKTHFIIVTAEGAGDSEELAKYIQEKTGMVTRVTVLGHVQRGGSPTARDRIMATRMGYKAVELLAQGKSGRVVVYKNGEITDFDIEEGLAMTGGLDLEIAKISNMISL